MRKRLINRLDLVDVLDGLLAEAVRMENECKHPPCSHAWGIKHAISKIERELGLPGLPLRIPGAAQHYVAGGDDTDA